MKSSHIPDIPIQSSGVKAAGSLCLNACAVKQMLKTGVLGRELVVLESAGSTNDILKDMAAKGASSGMVVAAREQTQGKGRLGRAWHSPKDECLMFSVLLRPNTSPRGAAAITQLTGLAVCRAIAELTGIDCKIKWPNDIIAGGKKLAGILTEMSAEQDSVDYVVTGIGINVLQSSFPEELAHKATSLLLETGKGFDQNNLLAALLARLEHCYTETRLSLTDRALGEYSALCATLGRQVSFVRGGAVHSGRAEAIAPGGELLVRLGSGETVPVGSGEVTVQGIY